MKISKNKNAFLSHVPMITQPKHYIPRSKGVLCSPVTDRQKHTHESEYRGHIFRVSGIFLSTYHQGSAQLSNVAIHVQVNDKYCRGQASTDTRTM